MGENVGDRIEKVAGEQDNDAEAVEVERIGRTNAASDMTTGSGQAPGRWDSIGEGGEGLDELQGLYAADSSTRDHLPERRKGPVSARIGTSSQTAAAITPALWDKLTALEGETVETPKGEPFAVKAVTRGERVAVSPLDGGQEWEVSAQELEAAWSAVSGGSRLDGLASIRLQEAGLGSAHPEYVAGLLHAITPGSET